MSLSAKARQELESALGMEGQVRAAPPDLERYGKDWLSRYPARPVLEVFPRSSQEVSFLVHWARRHGQKLVPSGGRTGLSGGAAATSGEVAVSLDRMHRILRFEPVERSVEVEAGVVTRDLKVFAQEKGLFFPITFAAEGSSQIGGNIATNAGGAHVLRYGSMRERVLGLEVVTGRGEILNLNRGLIKNASGYRLMELFIGSEGTLGFITKAVLSLTDPPSDAKVFLLSLEKWGGVPFLFQKFKSLCQPLAFEALSDAGLELMLQKGLKFPLQSRGLFYILVEIEAEKEPHALAVFEEALEKNFILDGTVSQNFRQARELMSLRENLPEALASHFPHKNDIAVRISRIPSFLQEMEEMFRSQKPCFPVVWFGHLGDGNLHINTLTPKDYDKEKFLTEMEKADASLFSLVRKFEGTVSAEHGVGLLKKPYLHYTRSKEEMQYMQGIKSLFDPQNIINPGKILPEAIGAKE